MSKQNQLLEHLGFGITEETEDTITYYLEVEVNEEHSVCDTAISIISDWSKSIYYHSDGTWKEVYGVTDGIALLQEFIKNNPSRFK